MARKERENQTKMEKKVNEKASREEGAEVQSPRRKVIRVESEETEDYVRESLKLSLEEAEEMSFVPSALSIPRGLLVVQTGAGASQAKVFKAHAAPQGLCENLMNALNLLANQTARFRVL